MTTINNPFSSLIWMASTLDNKKESETKLNNTNPASYPIHSVDNSQEEKRKLLTLWPNNSDSTIFNNQSLNNSKVNLSVTTKEFYNIAHDEQN